MKLLKEYSDGFRWSDGLTESAPFTKTETMTRIIDGVEEDYNLYNDLIDKGYQLVLMTQADKDAHKESIRLDEVMRSIRMVESRQTNRLLREAALGVTESTDTLRNIEAKIKDLRLQL